MNVFKFLLALSVLIGFLVVIGFGIYLCYEYLLVQWNILKKEWQAVLVLLCVTLICCTFYITHSFRNTLKKYGPRSTGKVMAYNDFIQWFSLLKTNNNEAIDFNALKSVTNQLLLWGNQQVVKQVYSLIEKLQSDESDRDQVLVTAEHIYEELRHDLGVNSEIEKRILF